MTFFSKRVSKMLSLGFRFSREDLSPGYSNLHIETESFYKTMEKQDFNIKKAFVSYFYVEVLKIFIWRFLSDILAIFNPIILHRLLILYQDKENNVKFLLWTSLLWFTLKMLDDYLYEVHEKLKTKFCKRMQLLLKNCLYLKTLRISDLKSKNEIFTLISNDVSEMVDPLGECFNVVKFLMTFIFAFTYLYILLGWSSFLSMVVCFAVLLPVQLYSNRVSDRSQKYLKNLINKRIKIITEVIKNIEMVKSYFLESFHSKKIQELRDKELDKKTSLAYIWGVIEMVWNTSTFFLSCFSLIAFSLSGNKLDIPTAFTVIYLVRFLVWPICASSEIISSIIKCKLAIKRFETFMKNDEVSKDDIIDIYYKERNVCRDKEQYIFSIKDGSFSWTKNPSRNEILLRNINLNLKVGLMYCIAGEIGSGKSSLLCSITGEMKKLQGKIYGNRNSISYCSQDHFIQGRTIQSNILFGLKMDFPRYQKTLKLCALKKDLEQFKLHDLTLVGPQGITLSGGQKSRISIARAFYLAKDKDLFLLDDCFKDLDHEVSDFVFKNVIGELKRMGKTIVLVTHNLNHLQHEYVDKVIEMKNGEILNIVSQDSFLKKSKPNPILCSKKPEKEQKKLKKKHSIVEEKKEGDYINFSIIWEYFTQYYPRLFLLYLLMLVIKQILEQYVNYWMGKWSTDTHFVLHSLYYYIFGYLLFGVLFALFVYLSQVSISFFVIKIARLLHHNLLKDVMSARMTFFDSHSMGTIISRFSDDQNDLDKGLRWRIRESTYSIIAIISGFGYFVVFSPLFPLCILPILYLMYLNVKKYTLTVTKLTRLSREEGEEITSQFSDTINGLQTIRGFGTEKHFMEDLRRKLILKSKYEFSEIEMDSFISFRGRAWPVTIIFLFSVYAILTSSIPQHIFALIFTQLFSILNDVSWLTYLLPSTLKAFVALERVIEYKNIEKENDQENLHSNYNYSVDGNIEFRNIWFKYLENEKEYVLKNVNFKIKSGEKVGVSGRTGSGKSSLVRLLFKLYSLKRGDILFNGISINDIPFSVIRTGVSYISQNPSLFAGSTIGENLDPKNIYSDSEIWDALRRVKIYDTVYSLVKQLDTLVDSIKFSCGERQLLCFCRALLEKKKVLIFDESMSSCDNDTADHIIKNLIRKEFKDCTIIMIAHRRNTLKDCERIFTIKEGELLSS